MSSSGTRVWLQGRWSLSGRFWRCRVEKGALLEAKVPRPVSWALSCCANDSMFYGDCVHLPLVNSKDLPAGMRSSSFSPHSQPGKSSRSLSAAPPLQPSMAHHCPTSRSQAPWQNVEIHCHLSPPCLPNSLPVMHLHTTYLVPSGVLRGDLHWPWVILVPHPPAQDHPCQPRAPFLTRSPSEQTPFSP